MSWCRSCVVAGALASVVGVAGCASETAQRGDVVDAGVEGETLVWVPNAAVRFGTFDRDTLYALKHSPSRDLLIVEQREAAGRQTRALLTWLVEIPAVARLDDSIAIEGAAGAARAWLLEDRQDQASYGAPATGSIIVHDRSPGSVEATLTLEVRTGPAGPGEVFADRVALTRRGTWRLVDTTTANLPDVETRGGDTFGQLEEQDRDPDDAGPGLYGEGIGNR